MESNKKTSEMSLDEVLSSIKKMVIDEEPPVLELTDMVSDDGSIVSIKKKNETENKKNNDMSSFLKLIQEDAPHMEKEIKNVSASKIEPTIEPIADEIPILKQEKPTLSSNNNNLQQENVMHELIIEAITPLLKKWIDQNLPSVMEKIVEAEVKKFLYKKK